MLKPTFQKKQRDADPIAVEDAQLRVLEAVVKVGDEACPLSESAGRILRADVVANRDVPSLDNSAMDGYAVLADDVASANRERPVRLPVIGEVAAGVSPVIVVIPRTAARIMTGAPIPRGADSVVPVELTDAGEKSVSVFETVKRGANVRRAGEDMRSGQVVLRSGVAIGPGEIAVLATLQKSAVTVARRPRVAIIATGNELVGVDEELQPGMVVNSNSYALEALVNGAGGEAVIIDRVIDDEASTSEAIRNVSEHCDFIITTGGVSVGAHDYVKDSLDALGAETKFWRVAMKPGKPVIVSTLNQRMIFGLPGNPVSCMVSFHLFVAPAIRKAMGASEILPTRVRTRLGGELKHRGDRRAYQRVHVVARDGDLVSVPMSAQGSGITTSMVGANGLAIVEPGRELLRVGEIVDTLIIGKI